MHHMHQMSRKIESGTNDTAAIAVASSSNNSNNNKSSSSSSSKNNSMQKDEYFEHNLQPLKLPSECVDRQSRRILVEKVTFVSVLCLSQSRSLALSVCVSINFQLCTDITNIATTSETRTYT